MKNDEKIKISFIMSVYNTKLKWINRAVNSVKNQSNGSWELIIVDDGSREEIASDLDGIARTDTRISVKHQSNQGLSVARNYGMNHAHGSWVTFIDADDWIAPEYVEKLLSVAEVHTKIDALGFDHVDVWNEKKPQIKEYNETYREYTNEDRQMEQLALLSDPVALKEYSLFFGAQWKFVYRVDFLNKYEIRNTPGLYKAQDSVFNLYVTEQAKCIGYINIPLYFYFHNEDSVTSGRFNRGINRFLKLLEAYYSFLDDTGHINEIVYKNAYVKCGLLQFEAMLATYFTHKDNTDNYITRKEMMRKILQSEQFEFVLREVSKIELSLYRRILSILMINENYYGICILYKIKRNIKRFVMRKKILLFK